MPEVSQVHIDTALTNVSVQYRNNDFLADRIAPPVPVRKQSDRYYVYDAEREWLRATADDRAPGAEANEVNFSLSSDSYFCADHALEAAIPDEERDNADPAIQPEIDRTEFLTEKIGLNREIALETVFRTDSGITEVDVSADPWTDPASDPLAVFSTARQAIFQKCHRRPNTIVLPYAVFDTMRNHPAIVDRVKYSALGVVGEELLAQVLEVDRILVSRAFKNTATKGQTASVTPIWGSNAYMLYVAPRPSLKQVSAAYSFVWTGAGGSVEGGIVERWREPRRKADMIRVQKYYDHKVIAPGASYRILGCLG
ncbi:MAG: hypothetical protein K1X53_16015 [Candidatus Sumerlaeaceae bacterium]|nr:hypothetical protein [Candidatus Sumerlaeaceae bacterium]